jgi:hypothetical protein
MVSMYPHKIHVLKFGCCCDKIEKLGNLSTIHGDGI